MSGRLLDLARRAARAVLLVDDPPARPHPVLDLDALDALDPIGTAALAAMLAARAIHQAPSDHAADAIAAALIEGIAEEHTHGRAACSTEGRSQIAHLEQAWSLPAYRKEHHA